MIHVRELDHIVLNVADVERSLRFYATEGLGLEPERLDAYRGGEAPFPSVRVTPGTIIDLFPLALGQSEDGAPSGGTLDHFCLVIDGTIEAVQAHLATIGIAVERGPSRVFGARGYGTSVYVRDPDGTLVELRTYP